MDWMRGLLRETGQVTASILGPTFRSLRENSGVAVLSIVLAFGLWVVVTDSENPTRTRVLPVDIPVQAIDLPADLALAESLSPVRVRIRVADDVFDGLIAADFEATVDLDGLTIGAYELPVQVRPLTSRGGLRIEDVLPTKIEVNLVQLAGKSVPVVVDAKGNPPHDFVMSAPEAGDITADVSGPQAKVALVTQVVASLDVDGRTETVEQAVRLQPRDERGLLVSGVAVDPTFTQVIVEIEQQVYRRALIVSPDISGVPEQGYNVTGVSVSPATVVVTGSKLFIEQSTSIRTQPVDVAGADKDVVRSVSLDVPSGVQVVGGVNVTVTVKIAAGPGQVSLAIPVMVTNLGSGMSVSGVLPSVVVTLYGPLPTLLGLSPNDVAAAVDLKDQDAGSHKVKVKVTPPAGVEVRSVAPEEIDVTLEKQSQ